MKNKKRGVSPVIATILLVLITVAAVALVWKIINPMIRERLEKGTICFELIDYAKILDESCYNVKTRIMIERGMENITIKGFRVSILSEGSSISYDLTEEMPDGVAMLTGEYELPKPGEARTYVFDTLGEKATLGIISKEEEICKMGSYNIQACVV